MSVQLNIEYHDWHAVHDHMGKTLRVYGNCTVRGGGFALSIEPRIDQGINPQMLLLNLRVTATGESPSRQAVDYEQPWDEGGVQYGEVGLVVVGDLAAAGPPVLQVEDVY